MKPNYSNRPGAGIQRFNHEATQILRGPNNLTLALDPKQVFPDDPGQGTPLMVWRNFGQRNECGATLGCALATGELSLGDSFTLLTPTETEWLMKIEDDADAWLSACCQWQRAAADAAKLNARLDAQADYCCDQCHQSYAQLTPGFDGLCPACAERARARNAHTAGLEDWKAKAPATSQPAQRIQTHIATRRTSRAECPDDTGAGC